MITFIKCPVCQKYVKIELVDGEYYIETHSLAEGEWLIECVLSEVKCSPRSNQECL